MIEIQINHDELKEMYLQKVDEHIKKIEQEVFFFDSKQLQKFVNMSWNSTVEHLLSDPKFPKIRLGHKWLFPRREVEVYMQKYYEAVRDSGGDIQKYTKR